jgi:hypothetical protein
VLAEGQMHMDGRRRHPRFLLPDAWLGTLCLSEDVTVEEIGNHEMSVLSLASAQPGEEFTLELPDGPGANLGVVVLDGSPVITDLGLRYRLRLRVHSIDDRTDNTKDTPDRSTPQSGNPESVNKLSRSEGDA